MKINPLALLPLLVAAGGAADLQPLPLNADDFDQPAWETSESDPSSTTPARATGERTRA